MIAVREAIFAEIERRLRALPGIAEVERMPAGDPEAFPAFHVFDNGQNPTGDDEPDATRYGLSFIVDGFVDDGETGAATHGALNQLYCQAVEALMSDPPLGGLAETIDEGGMRMHSVAGAAERGLGFSLDFAITFPTRRGRPAQAA